MVTKSYFDEEQIRILDAATNKRVLWEQNRNIIAVTFELTARCNFKCIHCYLEDEHSSEDMAFEDVIKILDLLHNKGVLFITFTGGEIFARNDFIDIYVYAKRKGFIIKLYTNGMEISDQAIEVLIKYPPIVIDISLYGSCEQTYKRVTGVAGAFNKVINNIKKLKKAGIRVTLKTPVLSIYYDELDKMAKIAKDFDISFRVGFEIFPTINCDVDALQYQVSVDDALNYEFRRNSERKNLSEYESENKQYQQFSKNALFKCKIGSTSCVIDYEGKMFPCMSFRHIGKKMEKDNFDEIWESFGLYSCMEATETYKCNNCDSYIYCDSCPALMHFMYSNYEYIDEHFCYQAKARKAYYEGKV